VLEELSTPGLQGWALSALQILHLLISWQTPKAGSKHHITLSYASPETVRFGEPWDTQFSLARCTRVISKYKFLTMTYRAHVIIHKGLPPPLE